MTPHSRSVSQQLSTRRAKVKGNTARRAREPSEQDPARYGRLGDLEKRDLEHL